MNKRLHTGRLIGCSLLLALLAGGCSIGSEEIFFVQPGAYEYFSCADIAKATQEARQRELDLKILIDRAEQSTFGSFIATAAYRSQYLKAAGDLRLLADAAQRKKCPDPSMANPLQGPVQTSAGYNQ